jgi:hypothetical protein
MAVSAIAPQAAQAVTYRPIYYQYFGGASAVADCNASGVAGRTSGRWDFYRCTPANPGQTLLTGYAFIS